MFDIDGAPNRMNAASTHDRFSEGHFWESPTCIATGEMFSDGRIEARSGEGEHMHVFKVQENTQQRPLL